MAQRMDSRRQKWGPLAEELSDEAKKNNWNVISMKNDWKRIFAFE